MKIKDVSIGSRVRINLHPDRWFDEYSQAFDPDRPYIDGVLTEGDAYHRFISWREGEETTDITCPAHEDGFVRGAYVSPDAGCVLAP